MRSTIYTLLLVALCCISCNLDGNNDIAIISTVRPELKVDLVHPANAPGALALLLSTLNEECNTSELRITKSIKQSSISIVVDGLVSPQDCTDGYDVIKKELPFELIPGTYILTISIGNSLTSFGQITFDGKMYTLNLAKPQGISVGESELLVIPTGLIWGSISGSADPQSLSTLLNDNLKDIATEAELEPGNYGFFSVRESSLVPQGALIGDSKTLVFVYMLHGSNEELKTAIEDFRSAAGANVDISCMSWEGISF